MRLVRCALSPRTHTYILGINAYDHDVSACLLRDRDIAFAILLQRITRRKHDAGFHQEVVDYCLKAEGVALDDVDLVVRNCYILPIHDIEVRLFTTGDMPLKKGSESKTSALFIEVQKVITVSHYSRMPTALLPLSL